MSIPFPADPRAPSAAAVDFVIMTALEEERDAVLIKLPGHRKLEKDGSDVNTYYEADIVTNRTDGAIYRVLVTCLAGMGPLEAATHAAGAAHRWRPRHVLMVGIAGGVSGEVELGDVIVANQVVDYSLGKVEGGERSIRWEAHRADADLLDSARNLPGGWTDLVSERRPDEALPKRRIGVVASGGDVIAYQDMVARYQRDWPKLLGVEMEGGGVATALSKTQDRPRFLMIRGVSDLADHDKSAKSTKAWRPYACDVAAAYTIGFLRSGPVVAARRVTPNP